MAEIDWQIEFDRYTWIGLDEATVKENMDARFGKTVRYFFIEGHTPIEGRNAINAVAFMMEDGKVVYTQWGAYTSRYINEE